MYTDIHKNGDFVHIKSYIEENIHSNEISIIFYWVNLINLFVDDILCISKIHHDANVYNDIK